MLIALDYDGTYTADPEMWELVIKLLQLRGHEVVAVTGRLESEPIYCSCMKYYTSYKAKRDWCKRNGLHVDIWIDDSPDHIVRDYSDAELQAIGARYGAHTVPA